MRTEKKLTVISTLTTFLVLGLSTLAMAAGGSEAAAGSGLLMPATLIGAALVVGIAACGGGIGVGLLGRGLMEGSARNPEMSGKMLVSMLIVFALIETFTIYGLVIGLILLYANPFM
ncbi:MAG: ATP synthase F0 subunit C [Thermodesulfobacteriota bacterium]